MYSQTYKRYVTILLLVVYTFNQVDRAIFGILMEPIKREFALSDTQLGFLGGPALLFFYAILGIPVARWADRSHRVNIMTVAVALWSGIVMLCAAVGTFWQLALTRVGVGIGEAGFSAVAQSVIADYHSAAERTRAMSIFMLALPFGVALSGLMGGWINETHGWRAAFIAAGMPGIVLAVLLKLTVREPARGALTSVVPVQSAHPSLQTVLHALWRRKALRHLAIAMTLLTLLTGGLLGWVAPFFIRNHGLSTGELGTWLAFNAGVGGGLGIWLSGNLVRRFKVADERAQTRVLAVSAALAWPLLIALLLWPAKTGALVLWFAVTLAVNFFFAPSFALVQSLSGAHMRATMLAVVIFCQIIFSGVIGLQLTGVLSDALVPYLGANALRWAMIVMTPAALWAGLHFWLAGQSIRQDLMEVTGLR